MKFSEIFKDDNSINEKAIVGFIAFSIMIIVMLADIISNFLGLEFKVDDILYNSFLYLVLGCFGIAGIEKIFNKNNNES